MDETQLHVPDRVEPSQTPVIVANLRPLLLVCRQALIMLICALDDTLGLPRYGRRNQRQE